MVIDTAPKARFTWLFHPIWITEGYPFVEDP
jgi:hypothetical protein